MQMHMRDSLRPKSALFKPILPGRPETRPPCYRNGGDFLHPQLGHGLGDEVAKKCSAPSSRRIASIDDIRGGYFSIFQVRLRIEKMSLKNS